MVYLSEKEKIEILIMRGWGGTERSQQEVCDLFNATYPNRNPITQSVVSKIENKFSENGHVRTESRRHVSVREEVQLDILLQVEDSPHITTRQLAADNGISQSSVVKYLKIHKWHPYKVQLVHEINEDDPDRRLEFCADMMERCNADPFLVNNIIFTDEATFYLNGTVNKQNCRYWSHQNPHWMMESRTQYPEKLNVWAGIIGNRILGPYFIEGGLTGEKYCELLTDHLIPALNVLYPNAEDPDIPNADLWYQQDGAPAHYYIAVRNILDQAFPGRWIGRRGAIEWPARSPDLTPMDFFLWGYLKSKVYFNRPRTIEELKERIRQKIQAVTPEMLQNVRDEFINRLGICQVVLGSQFEHLIS